MISTLATAFGAGFLASLSPCVYPIIPITLGFLGQNAQSQDKEKKSYKPLFFFFVGHTAVLIALGVVAAKIGESFGFASQDPRVQLLSAALLIGFGIFSLAGKLPKFAQKANNKTQGMNVNKYGGFLAPFLIGATAALLASPCSTPVLASTLTYLASSGSVLQGILLMSLYSTGFLLLFFLLGLGVIKKSKLPKSGKWMSKVHLFTSWLLIGVGIYYGYIGLQGFWG